MMFEILIALLLGIIAGTFTGLFPGIHINLVAMLLFLSSGFFLQFTTPEVLVVFIVTMAVVHIFLDFIPSIFLGAPEESTALSVLPGHSLLLEGKGYEAIRLTTFGSYIGLIIMILITPLFVIFLNPIYQFLQNYIAHILIFASLFLIIKEDKKILALIVFLLAGVLGIATLNFPIIKEPLFPLLTGLFGTSMLLISISEKTKIPKQIISKSSIDKKESLKIFSASIISGSICSFMPGLGASQAAVLGSDICGKIDRKGFLVLLGAISTIVTGLNFIALYAINKPRSGTAIIIGKILDVLNLQTLLLILITALIAGSISVFITLYSARKFSEFIEKVNYPKLCAIVSIILILMSILISGLWSIPILIVATSLGVLTNLWGIRKMHLMGCLMLPVILYFL